MKLFQPHTIKEIADFLGCEFKGNPDHLVEGINEIHTVEKGDLVFVDHPKYYDKALESSATTILIDKPVEYPEGKALIISTHPFDDFNRLLKHFKPRLSLKSNVGDNTFIDNTAEIYPNVTIGNNVIIGSNTVIGHSAFYYKKKTKGFDRLHTCGGVVLKKNAEIGALCTIDAGVTANTVIGEGTKLDNQVHVGHDSIIGKHCLLAANVGVAGCVHIHDRVTLWGQVGCAHDIVIGEGAIVFAQSGISKSLAGGKTYFGSPAKDIRLAYREIAAIRKLPEILENL
jgi:UDP-3-O-[3-hydroxymyristoyl] glucosamine N-acyltransferase